ncbi:MAG: phage capsid protein [Kaiparowitsia implicata GSE-PSE-MK54-09C]|jgi:hypothetical protein|nr:phage capsid protein [Kaiparowitsia implicata GSE-PSE-MK54-09C]
MAISPYPTDPHLTGLAIAYKNTEYIADFIAPYRPVSKQEFEWDDYTLAEMYTVPDTKVGRLSRPNQTTFSATRQTASTEDYALDSPVPQRDIDNADANYNPLSHATEGVMELIKLDREIRVANQVFNLNTYLASQRTTLTTTARWSQLSEAASTPISDMLTAFDSCLMRPNTLLLGQAGWTLLRQHPDVIRACRPNSTQPGEGFVTVDEVRQTLEIDNLWIGRSWKNVAKPGQAFTKNRIWGLDAAALYINPQAQLVGTVTQPTFMLTARFGTPVAGQIADPHIGMRGGVNVRAGESVKEFVTSVQGSYFWKDAFTA